MTDLDSCYSSHTTTLWWRCGMSWSTQLWSGKTTCSVRADPQLHSPHLFRPQSEGHVSQIVMFVRQELITVMC